MALVNLVVGKRSFELVCGDGQEEHLKNLAKSVNEKIEEMGKYVPASAGSEMQVVVMAALMLQDQVNESKAKLEQLGTIGDKESDDAALLQTINTIAEYVETIADRLEKA